MNNPFLPGPDFNLTEQGRITKENPGLAENLRREADKSKSEAAAVLSYVRTLGNELSAEKFNALTPEQKVAFGSIGGNIA
jgi:hypothetical protein